MFVPVCDLLVVTQPQDTVTSNAQVYSNQSTTYVQPSPEEIKRQKGNQITSLTSPKIFTLSLLSKTVCSLCHNHVLNLQVVTVKLIL